MQIFILEKTKLVPAEKTSIEREEIIENWFANSPWALIQDENILWIGRQTSAEIEARTIFPDMVGIDLDGNIVIVEFKRGRTPREVVAQLFEYAAWANDRTDEQFQEIADDYFQTRNQFKGKSFHEIFCEEFETDEVPLFNRQLRLFIVAEEISSTALSICKLLRSSYKVDVDCLVISMFQTETDEIIISVDNKLGNEVIVRHRPPRLRRSQTSSERSTKREVVWKAITELTDGDINREFVTREVIENVLNKDPNFNENTIHGQIHLFRRSKQVVINALQVITDEETDSEIPMTDLIVETVLQEHSRFNQVAIRQMVEMFRQSNYDITQLSQEESETENTA